MAIGIIVKKLVLNEVVVSLLSKEVRQKDFESTNEALLCCGRLKEKGKKGEKGQSEYCGRHKSPKKSKEKCWSYNKVRNFRKDYKEKKKKNKKENNYCDHRV